jgi:uncharacterized protein (DUF58 family)
MVPTLRLVLLIAAASVPFAAAMVQPGLVRAGVIADVVLLVAVVLDWLVTPKPRELEARIRAERVASLGSPFTVTLEIVNRAREAGLLINCTQDRVLRIIPAMIVTKRQIDLGIRILDRVFSEVK